MALNPSSSGESHQVARRRRLASAMAVGSVARVLQAVLSFTQIPIALHALGAEAFGIWITLNAAQGMLTVLDFGIGYAMQNKISEAFARGDYTSVSQLYVSGVVAVSLIAFIVFPVGIFVVYSFNWGSVLSVSHEHLVQQLPTLVVLFLAFFCLNLVLNTAQRLAMGLQMGSTISIWQIAAGVMTFAAICLAAKLGFGLTGFYATLCIPLALGNVGLICHVIGKNKMRFPSLRPDPVRCRQMFRDGSLFLIPQIGAVSQTMLPTLLITSQLGPASAIPYNMGQRLLSIPQQVVQLYFQPFWPAYAEAAGRNDHQWIRDTYRKTSKYAWMIGLVCASGFALLGPTLINMWTGNPVAVPSLSLTILQATWFLLTTLAVPMVTLLNGLSRLAGQASYGTISCLFALLGMCLLVRNYGAGGVLTAQCLSYLLIALPFLRRETLSVLKHEMCR